MFIIIICVHHDWHLRDWISLENAACVDVELTMWSVNAVLFYSVLFTCDGVTKCWYKVVNMWRATCNRGFLAYSNCICAVWSESYIVGFTVKTKGIIDLSADDKTLRLDYVDAQADLKLHSPHLSEDLFTHYTSPMVYLFTFPRFRCFHINKSCDHAQCLLPDYYWNQFRFSSITSLILTCQT